MWQKKGSCMKSPRLRKVYPRSQIPLQVLNLQVIQNILSKKYFRKS